MKKKHYRETIKALELEVERLENQAEYLQGEVDSLENFSGELFNTLEKIRDIAAEQVG